MFEDREVSNIDLSNQPLANKRIGGTAMRASTDCPSSDRLDLLVESFESQWFQNKLPLRDFLDSVSTPNQQELVELIRCEIEFLWQDGKPVSLTDYLAQFPELANYSAGLQQIGFEEYRQRQLHDQVLPTSHFQELYDLDTSSWPNGLGSARPEQTSELNQNSDINESPATLPRSTSSDSPKIPRLQPGDSYDQFVIVGPLGEGAFGCVYLATQGELSNRFVVLKISNCESREPQILAEMQHTNIMPILSLHRQGSNLAICMPFLGTATLRDFQKYARDHNVSTVFDQACLDTVLSRKKQEVQQILPVEFTQSSNNPTNVRENQLATQSQQGSEAATVWMIQQIAQGLAYAHGRGIIHGDLKPANVLISTDGQPLLLDFHLSQWTNRDGVTPEGGTLPYMSAEHLRGMYSEHRVDQRCDIFSLGVIFYELLTGQTPFSNPKDSDRHSILQLADDRSVAPKKPSDCVSGLSPDLDAIIFKCLAQRPEDRYQSCHQLLEDLQRYKDNLPLLYADNGPVTQRLRKWWRRNGSVATRSVIAATTLLTVCGLTSLAVYRNIQFNRLENEVESQVFQSRLADATQPLTAVAFSDFNETDSIKSALSILKDHKAESWQQWQANRAASLPPDLQRLERQAIARLYFWLAHTAGQNENSSENDDAVQTWSQRAGEFAVSTNTRQAVKLQQSIISGNDIVPASSNAGQNTRVESAAEALMLASLAFKNTARDSAASSSQFVFDHLKRAVQLEPENFAAWLALGNQQSRQGLDLDSIGSFSVCIALEPENPRAYFHRGLSYHQLKRFDEALSDFKIVDDLAPDRHQVYFNRSMIHCSATDWSEALKAIDRAIALKSTPSAQYLFNRAKIYNQLGFQKEAKVDLQAAISAKPDSELEWISRALAAYQLGDFDSAVADFEKALQVAPNSTAAFQNLAHIFSEKKNDNANAIRMMDQMVRLSEVNSRDLAMALATRGVLHARNADVSRALADAERALKQGPFPDVQYQAGCVFALCSLAVFMDDSVETSKTDPVQESKAFLERSIELLRSAAKQEPALVLSKMQKDPDLQAISTEESMQDLVSGLKRICQD